MVHGLSLLLDELLSLSVMSARILFHTRFAYLIAVLAWCQINGAAL